MFAEMTEEQENYLDSLYDQMYSYKKGSPDYQRLRLMIDSYIESFAQN